MGINKVKMIITLYQTLTEGKLNVVLIYVDDTITSGDDVVEKLNPKRETDC